MNTTAAATIAEILPIILFSMVIPLPLGLNTRFVKRFVSAGLIGPERSSALHHKHDAAREARFAGWLRNMR